MLFITNCKATQKNRHFPQKQSMNFAKMESNGICVILQYDNPFTFEFSQYNPLMFITHFSVVQYM